MARANETATETVALKRMDNCGFVNEKSNDPAAALQLTSAPTAPTHEIECSAIQTSCACVESETVCSCGSTPPAKSKVELLNWVKPKGWILLGIGFAFVAWSAIFFTLSALQMI